MLAEFQSTRRRLRQLALLLVALGGVVVGLRFLGRSGPAPVFVSASPAASRTADFKPSAVSPRADRPPLDAPDLLDRAGLSPAKKDAIDSVPGLTAALAETDPMQRHRRIMAVLCDWAAVEPDAAARAALAWPANDRVDPVAAVLAGVAARPEEVLRLGTFFCREDPAWAPEHGSTLINALSQAGQFSAAVSFALVGSAEVGGEERNKWLTAAFAGWAQREPQLAALAATSDLPDLGMQEEALIAVLKSWRRINPDGPEQFVALLPTGPERTALSAAVVATRP